MATAAVNLAGMWRKPSTRAQDSLFSTNQSSGNEARLQNTDNVQYRLCEDTSNLQSRLPGLKEVPRRRGGRRRKESRKWQEKRMDDEFDIVIVPPDGCLMSGSDSDDSDWSIGWFEPHPCEFNENDLEDSFAVLVPCYGSPTPEFHCKKRNQIPPQSDDGKPPAWATVLSNMSLQTSSENQKQVERWLASLQA